MTSLNAERSARLDEDRACGCPLETDGASGADKGETCTSRAFLQTLIITIAET